MPYGILKADTLTYYTASGDISIPVSGIAATVSGTIGIPSGTAAAPSISYVGDPDTGFYSPGANQVAIATSGTERLFVDASGNVGVGTSTPNHALTVAGGNIAISRLTPDTSALNLRVSAGSLTSPTAVSTSSNLGLINFNGYNGTSYATSAQIWGISDGAITGASSPGYLSFFTTPSGSTTPAERFRIDSSGRLLVGTSSAATIPNRASTELVPQLQIAGAGASPSTASIAGYFSDTTYAPALTFAKSNNASIGSHTAVADATVLGELNFAGSNGSSFLTAASISSFADGAITGGGANDMPGRLVFSTTADGASSPTERMRISNSGVVTIKNGAVAEIGTLTDGATITPDFAANCNFTVTITGNRTIANPTNITAGQAGSVFIVQGSGSNTVSWGSYWDFPSGTAPTLSTASGAVDRVDYIVRTATSIHTVFTANYS